MAYNTSNNWKTKVEGDDKSYVSYLLLNNNYVPMEQISKIDFIEDVIDSENENMYLGTFRSNQIDITFKNLNGLDIQSNLPVYLEIGLDTNYKELDCDYKYVQSGLKYFQLDNSGDYQYMGINKYVNISINNVMYNRIKIENYVYPDENVTYFGINLMQIPNYTYFETTDITYQSDTTYYEYNNGAYIELVEDTDYTVGDEITGVIYEREETLKTTDVVKVYPYEYIPKGYYLIEEPDENYYTTCKITCLDYAVILKTNCDYSSAIDYIYEETADTTYQADKTYYELDNNVYTALIEGTDYEVGDEITGVIYENTGNKGITIENLLKWICFQYGISLGTYPDVNRNTLISVYDSTLSGKTYISYIAELMGGNAKFNRNNELCIFPLQSENIKTQTTLNTITFDSTFDTKLEKLNIDGHSEQITTTGVNKYNVFDEIQSKTRYTTVDNDGWITMEYDNTNGSQTIYPYYSTNNLDLTVSTQYALMVEIKELSGTFAAEFASIPTASQNSTNIYTTSSNLSVGTKKYLITTKDSFEETSEGLRTVVGVNAGNKGKIVFRMSVLADTTVTPETFIYEKFTGNKPAPSPDYPQTIEKITGNINLELNNKNLYKGSDKFDVWSKNGVIDTENTIDGSYSLKTSIAWTGNCINFKDLYEDKKIKIGDTLTYSLYFMINFVPTRDVRFTFYRVLLHGATPVATINKDNIQPNTWYKLSKTITVNDYTITSENARLECEYYDYDDPYYFGNNRTNYVWFARPQLEYGELATNYVANNPSVTTINIGNNELCSLPNGVHDEFDVSTGTITKRVRHLSLAFADMDNSDSYPGWNNQIQLFQDYPSLNTSFKQGNISAYCNITNNMYAICLNTMGSNGTLFISRGIYNLSQVDWEEQYPDLVLDLYYEMPSEETIQITGTQLPNIPKGLNNLSIEASTNTPFSISYNYPASTINALKRETFKVNEKYEVSKVYYTDGSRVFEYGSDTANTLRIRQENMFIVDTTVVQNIYNSLNGIELYSLETKAPADLSLDCWDIINFRTDFDEETGEYLSYPTINNHKTTYAMSMIGTILTKIPTKQQENTTNIVETTEADNIRRIQTEINQLEGTFTVLAEDVASTKSDIDNNYYNKGTIDTMITDAANGVVNTFTTVGGDNVFRNTGLWFAKDNLVKRKLKVGDNLKNVTLYFNIPNNIDISLFNQYNPIISFENQNIYISSFYNSSQDGMITFDDDINFKSFDIFFKVNGESSPQTNISSKDLKEFYSSYSLECPDLIISSINQTFINYIEVYETDISNTYWEYWTGNANKINEIKSTNGNAIVLKNTTFSQSQNVNVGTYTISFVYKKLVPLANVTMEINNKEYVLDEEDYTIFTETSYFDSGQITVEFISDTENSCEIYDLMVNVGETSLPYNQNQNEITTTTVQISEGITINNDKEDTIFKADSDGIRVKDKHTNNDVTYFTKVGMETKQAVITDQSEIVGLLFQRVNGQTWISWLGSE